MNETDQPNGRAPMSQPHPNRSYWTSPETWCDPDCFECGGEGAPCCEPPDEPLPERFEQEIYLRWWANPEDDPLLTATVERDAGRSVLAQLVECRDRLQHLEYVAHQLCKELQKHRAVPFLPGPWNAYWAVRYLLDGKNPDGSDPPEASNG